MKQQIDFYFDIISPASYLAAARLPAVAAAAGAVIDWKPILLGGIFQGSGNAPPINAPAKSRYIAMDIARLAAHYGVPFANNPYFPFSTVTLQRAAIALKQAHSAALVPFIQAAYRAVWAEQRDLKNPAEIAAVAASVGLDAASLLAQANEPATKDALRAATDEAVARGAFGAPTMFIGDDMFFGQDRVDLIGQILAAT